MKLKQLGFAIPLVAALFSSQAFATDYFLGTDPSAAGSFVADGFDDNFFFTLTDASDLTTVAVFTTSNSTGHLDLFQATGDTTGGVPGAAAVGSAIGGFNFDGTTGSTENAFTALAAGSYVYHVTGTAVSDGDLYSVTTNVNISAVPEPETYALMLAGLGMLGFAARRRNHQA